MRKVNLSNKQLGIVKTTPVLANLTPGDCMESDILLNFLLFLAFHLFTCTQVLELAINPYDIAFMISQFLDSA